MNGLWYFSVPDDLVMYLTRFQWDMAQYPTKQNLKNIVDYIANVSEKFVIMIKLLSNINHFYDKIIVKHKPFLW